MVSSPVEFSGMPRRAWEPCIPWEPAGLTRTSCYRPLHLMGHRAQPTATGGGLWASAQVQRVLEEPLRSPTARELSGSLCSPQTTALAPKYPPWIKASLSPDLRPHPRKPHRSSFLGL